MLLGLIAQKDDGKCSCGTVTKGLFVVCCQASEPSVSPGTANRGQREQAALHQSPQQPARSQAIHTHLHYSLSSHTHLPYSLSQLIDEEQLFASVRRQKRMTVAHYYAAARADLDRKSTRLNSSH